jgi:NADPH-dependent 2,4-dienoyl-CoA reductase/sulfur reductase-like enzyme
MKHYDLIVIGAGSAGIAAALKAHDEGVASILVLEKDKEMGGILQQCIHSGFGVEMFKEDLTGPEYAERYIDKMQAAGLEFRTNSLVTELHDDRTLVYTNPEEGYVQVQAKAIILTMGCFERTPGQINLYGDRPAGIMTAGTAQSFLNKDGFLVGKRVFILGSGDIGLIMARRMTLEGAEVLGVAELNPYSSGLARNIVQCLDDFQIPLYLSHTVIQVHGSSRLESIVIAEVDAQKQPIPGTEKSFEVDTLLLSVGLIPDRHLTSQAGIKLHPRTGGPIVNNRYETNVPGIFAAGNGLHVHDLVDWVSLEGERAGASAARYIHGELTDAELITTEPGQGISYVVPHYVLKQVDEDVRFYFRVDNVYKNVNVNIYKDDELLKSLKKNVMVPAEMESVKVPNQDILDADRIRIEVEQV